MTDDPIVAGYFGVYLWAAAVKKGGTFETAKVREVLRESPTRHPKSRHHEPRQPHTQTVQIERRSNGQFEVV
jgi:urea transport system substrate-binding protein